MGGKKIGEQFPDIQIFLEDKNALQPIRKQSPKHWAASELLEFSSKKKALYWDRKNRKFSHHATLQAQWTAKPHIENLQSGFRQGRRRLVGKYWRKVSQLLKLCVWKNNFSLCHFLRWTGCKNVLIRNSSTSIHFTDRPLFPDSWVYALSKPRNRPSTLVRAIFPEQVTGVRLRGSVRYRQCTSGKHQIAFSGAFWRFAPGYGTLFRLMDCFQIDLESRLGEVVKKWKSLKTSTCLTRSLARSMGDDFFTKCTVDR